MTTKYDGITFRVCSDYENECVSKDLRKFSMAQFSRNNFSTQWEEVAQLIEPNQRNTFMFGSYNSPGIKKTDRQVDATGMMANSRFAAICDSLLTPRNMKWHQLAANNEDVMKDRKARLWFESATKTLFKYRYSPMANFASQNQMNYRNLGAFGNGAMFVDRYYGYRGEKGIRYRAEPLGGLYLFENHQGLVDSFIRHFRYTARQAEQKWPGHLPPNLQACLEKNSEQVFDFIQHVCPRRDYDADRLDSKSLIFVSRYICVDGKCLMPEANGELEGGYNTFPLAPMRYDQAPGEIYGRGPAMQILPALKTLNAEKTVFLKQGHRAADPVLLTHDDGQLPTTKPGSVNPGGMNSEGRPLIGILPTGNIQINKEMMEEERNLINDAFLVTLFQILTESPQMTATEVIERTNEKGILLAPTVGRQQSEYLGPLIDRELDLLSQMGLLDPMPDILKEAKGEYQVVYTSPLSRAMRAQEAAGFMRTVENVKELVAITSDPSLLDPFDFDVAIPQIAEIQAVPESWMASPEKIAGKRQDRAKQQQIAQTIQAAPAAAAMMKAQAAAGPQQGAPPA
jgi:hypothetical protein